MSRSFSSHRFVFSTLLLLALILRSFIPVGFMPKQTMTICSSAGTQTIYVSPDKIPDTDHHKAKSERCPFAPVFSVAMAAGFTMFAAPVYDVVQETVAVLSAPDISAFRNYFSTAPPIFS